MRIYRLGSDVYGPKPIDELPTAYLQYALSADGEWEDEADFGETVEELKEQIRIELLIREKGWK